MPEEITPLFRPSKFTWRHFRTVRDTSPLPPQRSRAHLPIWFSCPFVSFVGRPRHLHAKKIRSISCLHRASRSTTLFYALPRSLRPPSSPPIRAVPPNERISGLRASVPQFVQDSSQYPACVILARTSKRKVFPQICTPVPLHSRTDPRQVSVLTIDTVWLRACPFRARGSVSG